MFQFSQFEYLIVLLLVFVPTFTIALTHTKNELRPHLKLAFFTITLSAIPFLIWDYWATLRGHWEFNPKYNMGIYIANLPLEEVLFFFAVPFSCLFLWLVIKEFDTWESFKKKLISK